jgi:hypothetical protein
MRFTKRKKLSDKKLEGHGVSFLWFDDLDVKFRIDDVLNGIERWIDEHENTPRPDSLRSSGHPSREGNLD